MNLILISEIETALEEQIENYGPQFAYVGPWKYVTSLLAYIKASDIPYEQLERDAKVRAIHHALMTEELGD